MSRERLNYVATATLDKLVTDIETNLDRYRSGDFLDCVAGGGWSIELKYETDLSVLAGLDPSGTPEAELENSILVWQCFHDMTPALACENRVWTRLSHVECLEYSRARWGVVEEDEKTIGNIKKHFFAPTLNACRDDHSISRLWWNARIAKMLDPTNQRRALKLFLSKADIRSNFIERSQMVSRPVIGRAILRAIENDPWITAAEENFRALMKSVNFLGGGIVFELFTDDQMDEFLLTCKKRSEHQLQRQAA